MKELKAFSGTTGADGIAVFVESGEGIESHHDGGAAGRGLFVESGEGIER